MSLTERQARGIEFEAQVAQALGLRTVPGSGNKFYAQGDGRGSGLILSCKAEAEKSWATIRRQLAEAIEMSHGTGDVPGLALLDDDGTATVTMRLDDFARALGGDVTLSLPPPTRGEAMRQRGAVPMMMRGK